MGLSVGYIMDHIYFSTGATEILTQLLAFGIGFFIRGTTISSSYPQPSKSIQQYGYKKQQPTPTLSRAPGVGECPYEYLLKLYGRHHFAPFIKQFDPTLKKTDALKYDLILDIMDAVHFALILVDDISDDSPQRKNKPTAHLLYGSSETANRAYLVLTTVINRALRERPVLGMELMKALESILRGQDMSLVWRRDGLRSFESDKMGRISAYKEMAELKTGTLFVLLGRLVKDGSEELDDVLLRFGWYAQLQNDLKNVYSDDYAKNKGSAAEDLRNGELSFPIVIGLNDEAVSASIERALETHDEADVEKALGALQSQSVKEICLNALENAAKGLEPMVALWGRRERIHGN